MVNINLSLGNVPEIDRVGYFPLLNPVPEFRYRSPTHALHLYEYGGVMRLGGEEIEFKSGDITFTPAGEETSYRVDSPGKHWVIHFFDPLPAQSATFELPCHLALGKSCLFALEQFKLINHLFNAGGESRERHSLLRLEAAYRLKALLLSFYNLAYPGERDGKRSQGTFSWEELTELIEANIGGKLTLPWLASKMNISPNTLSAKFRKHFGQPIIQYIQHYRIDKAKSLLGTTTMTINEIGALVGIDDPQYFNKQFRRLTGMSPSRWRDENKPYHSVVASGLVTKGGEWKKREI